MNTSGTDTTGDTAPGHPQPLGRKDHSLGQCCSISYETSPSKIKKVHEKQNDIKMICSIANSMHISNKEINKC